MVVLTLHFCADTGLTDSAVEEIITATRLAHSTAFAVKLLFASLVVKQATDLTEVEAKCEIAVLALLGG